MSTEENVRRNIAIARQNIIKPLAMNPNHTPSDIAVAAATLDVHPKTIRRWVQNYLQAPVLDTLMPGQNIPIPRTSRLPDEVCEIIKDHVSKRLKKKEKVTAKSVWDGVRDECEKKGLPSPHVRTVERWLNALPLLDRAKANLIDVHPDNATLLPHHHTVAWPLDAIQLDHTKADALLDLTEYGLGKKRIWLTLAIDVASRMVFGYYLGLKPPSARTGGFALLQGMMPKGPWLSEIGISLEEFAAQGIANPWPIRGVGSIIDVDNGTDFRARAFARGCQQFGSKPRYRPRGKKHFGGHIERLLGSFMRQLHAVPGTTFSRVKDLKGYDSAKNCFLTLEDFELWLVGTILAYHLTPHEGLDGITPLQKYESLQAARPVRAELLPDMRHMLTAFLPHVTRTVKKQGVRLQNRYYAGPELAELMGRRVRVIYHPGRLDKVWVALSGAGPQFSLPMIGAPGRCRHQDALVDRLPTAAVKAEAERQAIVASRLRAQRDQLVQLAVKQKRRIGKSPPVIATPPVAIPKGRPLPFSRTIGS